MLQRTLKKKIEGVGIGLHSGKEVKFRFVPASVGTGIRFIRTDLAGKPEIPAHFRYVVNTQMATTLGLKKVTIGTVEHLLSALYGEGIDNLRIEVEGPEIPILDGSSTLFCELIHEAGIQPQLEERLRLKLKKRVEVKLAEKWAFAEPIHGHCLEVHTSVDWDHPEIGFQEYRYIEGRGSFQREIASARTFGFLSEVQALQRMGLALGGSLDNAIVLDETRVLNPEGLRFRDEFARHKVLDALGDFKLAGIAIEARFRLHRAGHEIHRLLLAEIFKDRSNYELIRGEEAPSAELALQQAQNLAARIGLAAAV